MITPPNHHQILYCGFSYSHCCIRYSSLTLDLSNRVACLRKSKTSSLASILLNFVAFCANSSNKEFHRYSVFVNTELYFQLYRVLLLACRYILYKKYYMTVKQMCHRNIKKSLLFNCK